MLLLTVPILQNTHTRHRVVFIVNKTKDGRVSVVMSELGERILIINIIVIVNIV